MGLAEGRLVACDCAYFARCGSACIHMYFLAREYNYLVVERAPNRHQSHAVVDISRNMAMQAVIDINSDSDIEIVNRSRSPAASKRSYSVAFSPGDDGDPKRVRLLRAPAAEFTAAHPTFLSATLGPSAPEKTSIPSVPTNLQQAPRDKITSALTSGTKTLKRAIDALKKKKDRVDMVNKSLATIMNRFQVVCHALLQSVEEQVPGRRHTITPSFPGVEATGRMSSSEVALLVGELLDVGRAALVQVDGLLRLKKNLKAFAAGSTELSMELFKERGYELVGILEDAGVLTPRVQVR